jgi:dipeptidyl aminopeptidase/acylaminoacyl peptidase
MADVTESAPAAGGESAAAVPELGRALLLGERNRLVRLSPDGSAVLFVRLGARHQELRTRAIDQRQERLLTAFPDRVVGDVRWSGDSRWAFVRHAKRGREAWALSIVEVATGQAAPWQIDGMVTELWPSPVGPDAVVSCRLSSASRPDLFRITAGSGAAVAYELVARNLGYHRWLVDDALRPRGGIRLHPDGSITVSVGRDLSDVRDVLRIDPQDAVDFAVVGFSRDSNLLHVLTSAGATTRRLVSIDVDTGDKAQLFAHPDLDVAAYPMVDDGVWRSPTTGEPDLCATVDQRFELHPIDTHIGDKLRFVGRAGATSVPLGRDAADARWLLARVHDDAPMAYEVLDTRTGSTTPLFVNRPELVGRRLARLEDFPFRAGDGRRRSGYVMRAPGRTGRQPTVVLVHSGPAIRDHWRFHAEAQFLASLGITSLHVNYVGSTGFGVEFRRAGDGEWGARMQQDLYDAVDHGVALGLVDPERIGYFGTSYGGYASLLAAVTRPHGVRCAVAISPLCDLVTFATRPAAYWQPLAEVVRRQITVRSDGSRLDDAELRRRSPSHVLAADCAPLLVAHGARDPRVDVRDVDAFVAEAREFGVPITYLRFTDEGHYVRSSANLGVLFAECDDFLRRNL